MLIEFEKYMREYLSKMQKAEEARRNNLHDVQKMVVAAMDAALSYPGIAEIERAVAEEVIDYYECRDEAETSMFVRGFATAFLFFGMDIRAGKE